MPLTPPSDRVLPTSHPLEGPYSYQEALRRFEEEIGKVAVVLPFASLAVYVSTEKGQPDLRLLFSSPDSAGVPTSLELASKAELERLKTGKPILVPSAEPVLDWLDPRRYTGASNALAWGHASLYDTLIVLLLGFNEPVLSHSRASQPLEEFFVRTLFLHLDTLLSTLSFNFAFLETGHLIGRSLGKLRMGTDFLTERLHEFQRGRVKGLSATAEWAIADGLWQLELARANLFPYRFGSGREDDAQEEFDVIALLRSMTPFFDRASAASGRGRIRYVLPEGPVVVRGDQSALRLVLLNLLDNGLKFSYNDTFLTLSASVAGSTFTVEMTNLGIGVPADERYRVFLPFFQSSTRDPVRRLSGAGLGLAYCRHVVEAVFKGTITLASMPAGHRRPRFAGDNWLTTVTVSIPLAIDAGDCR